MGQKLLSISDILPLLSHPTQVRRLYAGPDLQQWPNLEHTLNTLGDWQGVWVFLNLALRDFSSRHNASAEIF